MEKDWILIYSTDKEYLAQIFMKVLGDHGIKGWIINKRDRAYKTFGDIEIYVKQEHVIRAKMLAKEFEA